MINQSPPYEHNDDLVLQQFCFHWHYFCPTYFKSFLPLSLLGKHRKPLTILEQKIQIYFRKQNNIAQQDKSDILISLVKLPYLDQFKSVKEQSQSTPITSKWNKKGKKNDFFVCLLKRTHIICSNTAQYFHIQTLWALHLPHRQSTHLAWWGTHTLPHSVITRHSEGHTPYPILVLLIWSMLHWLG